MGYWQDNFGEDSESEENRNFMKQDEVAKKCKYCSKRLYKRCWDHRKDDEFFEECDEDCEMFTNHVCKNNFVCNVCEKNIKPPQISKTTNVRKSTSLRFALKDFQQNSMFKLVSTIYDENALSTVMTALSTLQRVVIE